MWVEAEGQGLLAGITGRGAPWGDAPPHFRLTTTNQESNPVTKSTASIDQGVAVFTNDSTNRVRMCA